MNLHQDILGLTRLVDMVDTEKQALKQSLIDPQ